MLNKYVADIALQMGVPTTKILIVDSYDVHYLQIFSGVHQAGALISKSELDDLKNGLTNNELEQKIRNVLNRLLIHQDI